MYILPPTSRVHVKMAGIPTLKSSLYRVILHTVVHHSSMSTYAPNFIEIEETFCGQTNGPLRPVLLDRLCRRVNLKTSKARIQNNHGTCTRVYSRILT